jgi:hypothetical protein
MQTMSQNEEIEMQTLNARSAADWTTTGFTALVFLSGGAAYLSGADVPLRGM